MVIYQVAHNLTYNTVQSLSGHYCKIDEFVNCFATKGEATKYASQIKKGLLNFVKDKRQEYKDSGEFEREQGEYGEPVLDVSPTKYIDGCGFSVHINKITLNGKEDIVKALSGVRCQEVYDYNVDCNPYDHYDCAVFKWDADEAGPSDHATREESYND
tara:strand:- start:1081 stop:1554 length:474 start_codon:yes stop_codon:yes gene_type:complete